jgi:dUTP pyrophosphatase
MKDVAVLLGHEVLKIGAVLGLLNSTVQVQPAGVDLTVGEVYRFRGHGLLGFSNESRVLPDVERLEFDDKGRLFLERGAYRVRYNEVVKVPSDCVAIGLPRSSLMRMGATVISALWDPGYEGRGEGLLIVENPHGIVLEKNARVMQLIFVKLASKPVSKYRGVYMREGLGPA